MRILGINCMNHDAAMAVVDGSEILWGPQAMATMITHEKAIYNAMIGVIRPGNLLRLR